MTDCGVVFDVTSDRVVCCSVEDAASVDGGEHNEVSQMVVQALWDNKSSPAPAPPHLRGPAPTLCHTQGTHSCLSSCALILSPVVIRYSHCPQMVVDVSCMSSYDNHSILSS